MEEHRLKEMGSYSQELFNDLYKQLTPLKKRLASQIDYKRFGVTYDDLLSWFDVKFIFTFQKYHEVHNPDVLRGHLISSLSFYKNRILRVAYKEQFSQNIIDLSTFENPENILGFEEAPYNEEIDLHLQLLYKYMKTKLSPEAYEVFMVDMNPPEYITSKLKNPKNKIPVPLVVEYLQLPERTGLKWVKQLRLEVEEALEAAKNYFRAKSIDQALVALKA